MITKAGDNSYTLSSRVSSAKCSPVRRDKVPHFRHPKSMQLFLRNGESAAPICLFESSKQLSPCRPRTWPPHIMPEDPPAKCRRHSRQQPAIVPTVESVCQEIEARILIGADRAASPPVASVAVAINRQLPEALPKRAGDFDGQPPVWVKLTPFNDCFLTQGSIVPAADPSRSHTE
jgi:hypothetical protein